jgi:hypothetical protein
MENPGSGRGYFPANFCSIRNQFGGPLVRRIRLGSFTRIKPLSSRLPRRKINGDVVIKGICLESSTIRVYVWTLATGFKIFEFFVEYLKRVKKSYALTGQIY